MSIVAESLPGMVSSGIDIQAENPTWKCGSWCRTDRPVPVMPPTQYSDSSRKLTR